MRSFNLCSFVRFWPWTTCPRGASARTWWRRTASSPAPCSPSPSTIVRGARSIKHYLHICQFNWTDYCLKYYLHHLFSVSCSLRAKWENWVALVEDHSARALSCHILHHWYSQLYECCCPIWNVDITSGAFYKSWYNANGDYAITLQSLIDWQSCQAK